MKKVLSVLLTIIMATIICVSFTACEEELPAAEEVIDGMMAVQEDIESYEMEASMGMKMILDIPEEEMSIGAPMDMDMKANITGAWDNNKKEMKMVVSMEMVAPDEDPMKMDMEIQK